MHAKSGGSSGEPPDFLFIPAACRSRKDLPRSAGGETGRGTRATVRGTQKTEPRARARGAGRGRRGHGHGRRVRGRGQQNTGNGGTKCRRRKTRAWGAGRKTRNAEHVKRGRGHGQRGHGVQDAERGTRNTEHGRRGRGARDAKRGTRKTWTRARARETGDGAQETGHKPPCMERNATAYAPPGPATTGLDRSQPGAIRRRDQSAGTFHGWTPAAGTRNNPPGHSQPGAIRHRDLQQPAGAVHSRAPSAAGRRYLSRVRIRITPLPPRTPYMLLPRCTSTDLTS